MIDEPTPAELAAVDFEALNAASDRAAKLHAAGTLDRKTFAELRAQALAAAGGNEALLDGLEMFNPEPPTF